MPFYKFSDKDIVYSRLKTYPKNSFWIYAGNVYYNDIPEVTGNLGNHKINHISTGHINLYEMNVDRPAGQLIYPFITKEGSLTSFSTVTTKDFNADYSYGDVVNGSYPLSASISIDYLTASAQRKRIKALKNTLDYYTYLSPHYAYSSKIGLGDKSNQRLSLISIPSIFYGSSINKGTVKLQFFVTGTLVGELRDKYKNGELIEVTSSLGRPTGSVAGVVLYNEGFMILTGTWDMSTHTEVYDLDQDVDNPSWVYFANKETPAKSSSFHIDFEGVNYVPTITMLAHAPKYELNFSSNPTYIEFNASKEPNTSSAHYEENTKMKIRNIVSSSHTKHSASFKKTTYISKIGIYDRDKNLIAIAKMANPAKKTEDTDYTFKLKLDI